MTEEKHHQRRRLRKRALRKWLLKAIILIGQLAAFFFKHYDQE